MKFSWVYKLLAKQTKDSCIRKVRYRSQLRSQNAVEMMAKKGVDGLEPYACPFCKGWHIGHAPEIRVSVMREAAE